jgi:hypothetical protein
MDFYCTRIPGRAAPRPGYAWPACFPLAWLRDALLQDPGVRPRPQALQPHGAYMPSAVNGFSSDRPESLPYGDAVLPPSAAHSFIRSPFVDGLPSLTGRKACATGDHGLSSTVHRPL